MIKDILLGVGALVGGALTITGLACRFASYDNTMNQGMGETLGYALLVVGVPTLALCIWGLVR